mmetsp:Transcript_13124/g.37926  ORF Transcript_13124/g.37926 Transcript_13124/m.37926 type:complete len:273 (+) Transcript_13124:1338-2156(+)
MPAGVNAQSLRSKSVIVGGRRCRYSMPSSPIKRFPTMLSFHRGMKAEAAAWLGRAASLSACLRCLSLTLASISSKLYRRPLPLIVGLPLAPCRADRLAPSVGVSMFMRVFMVQHFRVDDRALPVRVRFDGRPPSGDADADVDDSAFLPSAPRSQPPRHEHGASTTREASMESSSQALDGDRWATMRLKSCTVRSMKPRYRMPPSRYWSNRWSDGVEAAALVVPVPMPLGIDGVRPRVRRICADVGGGCSIVLIALIVLIVEMLILVVWMCRL